MSRHVTLIFVTYNSEALVGRMMSFASRFPVIIYDNASTDDTVHKLKSQSRHNDLTVISSEINLGYGRAANQAISSVSTPFAMLLNPDVEVTIEALEAIERAACSIEGRWLFLCPETGFPPTPYKQANDRSGSGDQSMKRVTFASGCAMLFNIDEFYRLGRFDENIFLFFEETDLCERARRDNLPMYYAPDIVMPHEQGISSPQTEAIISLKNWHYLWSQLYFYRKHRFLGKLYGKIFKFVFLYSVKLKLFNYPEPKRAIYLRRRSVCIHFLKGGNAFEDTGEPYRAPLLS